jgi:uncharacterized caspase-like protein
MRQYETPDLRALRYPEADAEELAKVLIKSGYRPKNVKVMTQRRGAEEPRYLPVASKVRKELGLILKHLDEGDSVVVALAGHGIQFQADEEAYFCPADAAVNAVHKLSRRPDQDERGPVVRCLPLLLLPHPSLRLAERPRVVG